MFSCVSNSQIALLKGKFHIQNHSVFQVSSACMPWQVVKEDELSILRILNTLGTRDKSNEFANSAADE